MFGEPPKGAAGRGQKYELREKEWEDHRRRAGRIYIVLMVSSQLDSSDESYVSYGHCWKSPVCQAGIGERENQVRVAP